MSVFYADFSAGVDGSGANTGVPWNTIEGKTVGASDVVWIRRSGTPLVLSASFTFSAGTWRGWPKAGDDIASPLPGNAWDSDVADYAEVHAANKAHTVTISLSSTGMSRIECGNDDNTGTTETFVTITGIPTFGLKDCRFYAYSDVVLFTGGNYITPTLRNKFEVKKGTGSNGRALVMGSVNQVFQLCDFKGTGGTTGIIVQLSPTTLAAIGMQGCTFSCDGDAVLFYVPALTTDRQTKIGLINCSFDDSARSGTSAGAAIQAAGCVWARNCTYNGVTGAEVGPSGNGKPSWWEFAEFTQTAAYTFALKARHSGTEVALINFTPHGSTTTPLDVHAGVKLRIWNGDPGTLRTPSIWVKDEAGALDAWRRRCVGGDAVRSSVTRTGGAPYSIKMTFDQDVNEKVPLVVGDPGRETILVWVPKGTRTLKVFLAYKTVSLDGTGFWVESEYYDSPSTNHRTTVSSRKVALVGDGSTWSDGTLTAARVELSLPQQKGAQMPVRIYLRQHSATGFVHVDPRPVIS